MHSVTQTELEGIASIGNSLNLGFLGISLGASTAFAVTLFTVDITDPIKHATFAGLAWISGFASAYFACRTYIDIRNAKRRLREIMSGN